MTAFYSTIFAYYITRKLNSKSGADFNIIIDFNIPRNRVASWKEGPLRGFGEQGNKAIYFRGTRWQKSKLKGTEEQRRFWGTENIENHDFDFGEQGKMLIFWGGNKGTGTPTGRALKSSLASIMSFMVDSKRLMPGVMSLFGTVWFKWWCSYLWLPVAEVITRTPHPCFITDFTWFTLFFFFSLCVCVLFCCCFFYVSLSKKASMRFSYNIWTQSRFGTSKIDSTNDNFYSWPF